MLARLKAWLQRRADRRRVRSAAPYAGGYAHTHAGWGDGGGGGGGYDGGGGSDGGGGGC